MTASVGTAEQLLELAADGIRRIDDCLITLDDYLDLASVAPLRRTLGHLLCNFYRYRQPISVQLAKLYRFRPAPEVEALLLAAAGEVALQDRLAPPLVVNAAVALAKRRHLPSSLVNAVLRRFVALWAEKCPKSKTWRAEELFPAAVFQRWQARFDADQLSELASAWRTEPEFSFRIEAGCPELDFPWQPGPEVSRHYRFAVAAPEAVLNSTAFHSGCLYIQDPAAATAPELADWSSTPKRVLDLCAAPGGKSLMLSERLPAGAELVAFDRSAARQKLTLRNFALRHRQAVILSDPGQLAGPFDLILVDAPCSNTGVFRRRPDALWRFSAATLRDICQTQGELLERAWGLLAVGGQLIYSTCSIEVEEDQQQVAAMLERHPGKIALETEKLLLPTWRHDGAYAARLRRMN